MKYMGSKLALLQNGLGERLVAEASRAERFVDLFTGTGRVAWHVAELVDVPVLAIDLQAYGSALAGAVVERSDPIEADDLVDAWLEPVRKSLPRTKTFRASGVPPEELSEADVLEARSLCQRVDGGPVWRSYGGHYFSPRQASTFDHLIRKLPKLDEPTAKLCHAALVLAASRCAAAPGHTAQPFQPTDSALPYIRSSWTRKPLCLVEEALRAMAPRHARVLGASLVGDANAVAAELNGGDVVFIDPPYSSVHYSRFYHVLETVARGSCGPVEGVGRYPPTCERPSSQYSIKTQAAGALLNLLKQLADNQCRVVLTFPQGSTSNGLNGEALALAAREWFRVDAMVVASRFSTLGGNGDNRSARRRAGELVLTMRPR